MNNNEIIKLVKKTLNKIRPYLQGDGGDVDFVKFEDGIVYVKLLGACIGCASSDETMGISPITFIPALFISFFVRAHWSKNILWQKA